MSKFYSDCPVETTLSLIGNKWKILIIRDLISGTKRYSELAKSIPDVSSKVLTQQLRELEKDNIISRKVYPEVPPRVEYSMTDFGNTLKPVLLSMQEWGNDFKKTLR